MRLVLLAGSSLPPHGVRGEITVQCIEGSIDITAEGRSHVFQAGQLLHLLGGVIHGVTALQNSSALVTVALRKQGVPCGAVQCPSPSSVQRAHCRTGARVSAPTPDAPLQRTARR